MNIQAEDYTRLEEEETLTKCGTVFFVNPQEFWGQTTLVFGTVEIRISLRFDKKYFASNHFRFVIFSLFLFRLIQKCLKT